MTAALKAEAFLKLGRENSMMLAALPWMADVSVQLPPQKGTSRSSHVSGLMSLGSDEYILPVMMSTDPGKSVVAGAPPRVNSSPKVTG